MVGYMWNARENKTPTPVKRNHCPVFLCSWDDYRGRPKPVFLSFGRNRKWNCGLRH